MKALIDRLVALGAPLKKHPLVYRAVGLLLALTLYSAGVLLVDSITHIGFLVALVALYFLPAVLRAWLLFYWQLRDDMKAWRKSIGKAF
jgi:hypothetical protein